MSKLAKLSLVIAGYVLACLAAGGAVSIYQRFTQSAAAQASAGMSAFGDLVLFIFLFGVFALFPTGLGLYYLLGLIRK
jgi:hypothetical protein